ncbi:MAG: hypothetical protein ACYCW6_30800 [Candidatus Xenobia bacterium]
MLVDPWEERRFRRLRQETLEQETPYAAERARFLGQHPELAGYASREVFSPDPFAVASRTVERMVELQRVIHRAVIAVVESYPNNPRIQRYLALSAQERTLLDAVYRTPYRVGCIRPDFVHARDGREIVTEINARFPLNGFLVSARLSPALAPLEELLCQRLGEDRLAFVRLSETSPELDLLKRLRPPIDVLPPGAVHGSDFGAIVLELHQHELVAACHLLTHGNVLNDLRTILLAHDKRLLALFTSDLMDSLVSWYDVQVLRHFVAPTWVKGLAPEQVREATGCPEEWVLKPARSGKGEGVVIGRWVTRRAWHACLAAAPDDAILQRYIPQQQFGIRTESGPQLMNVVGMLPTLDGHAFGPGIYRASVDPVVNLARRGLLLAPKVTP